MTFVVSRVATVLEPGVDPGVSVQNKLCQRHTRGTRCATQTRCDDPRVGHEMRGAVQAKKLRAELAKLQGREQDIADEDAREPAEQRAVSVPAGVVAVRVQPRASSRRMPGAEPPSVQQSNMPVMLVWEDGAAGALGQAGPEAVEKWAHLQLQATADEELQLDLSSEAGLA
eukprot:2538299-Rhodomonas_salina.1